MTQKMEEIFSLKTHAILTSKSNNMKLYNSNHLHIEIPYSRYGTYGISLSGVKLYDVINVE